MRPLDVSAHDAARDDAREAARFGGRAALLEDTSRALSVWLDRAFGTRSFDPTILGLAWRLEPLRADDIARLHETLDDAALAVATEDLIDEATYAELLGPCAMLVEDQT